MIGGGADLYGQYRRAGSWSALRANFNWASFTASTVSGALGGGLATGVARLGATALGEIALNSLGNAAIGAIVTAGQNELAGTCDSVVDSAFRGAVFGGLGAGVGLGIGRGFEAINRVYYESIPLAERLLLGSNALHGEPTPQAVAGGATIGGVFGDALSNLPTLGEDSD